MLPITVVLFSCQQREANNDLLPNPHLSRYIHNSRLFSEAETHHRDTVMSSFIAPRPAPSLPANETTPLSPKHTPRDPTKTFSKMMSHLKLGHENTEHKMDAQKTPTSRRASVAARASTNENPKRLSSILTHLVLPPSEQPTLKPSPKHKTTNQPPPNNPVLPTQTRYVDMLLGLDEVPRSHNLLASFSTWILLAGYIVVPGTFVSIEHSKALREGATHNHVEHALLDTVKHTSLIWVASLCCAVGATGMIWLWWRWRQNYVWLINKIFL